MINLKRPVFMLTMIVSHRLLNHMRLLFPNARAGFGITWSLGLGEMGLVFAMIVGLIIR